jgi:hypothetical protein
MNLKEEKKAVNLNDYCLIDVFFYSGVETLGSIYIKYWFDN